MSRFREGSGFSLVELLVALTLLVFIGTTVGGLLLQNTRINKSRTMAIDAQANARACLSMVVQKLRSAGWDPMNAGIAAVALDPDPGDNISQIEIFADLDMDGLTDGSKEQLLVRHVGDRVEWRPTNDPAQPFDLVAANISNDADGDGIPEAMFVADATPDPTRITVTVTAQSPVEDPVSGEFIRYTVSSEVTLRKLLPE